MSDICCVTNRSLCRDDFLSRIDTVASSGVDRIILREKDLDEDSYMDLAEKVLEICSSHGVECVLHSFVNAAMKLGCRKIHMPLKCLMEMNDYDRSFFDLTGTSIHSMDDLETARKLGCDYVTFGHVFATDCKRNLAPKGTDQLCMICEASDIPVYAIGGIDSRNARQCFDAGCRGVCIMSGFMTCESSSVLVDDIRRNL